MRHEIKTFNIRNLFSTNKYRIPIYQRNYAWGKAEISQLLQDILDYIPEQRNYYIGTLVVFEQSKEGNVFFDTIDGQQRLTTLSILLCVLRNEYNYVDWFEENILSFESRPLSQNALDFVFLGYFDASKEYHNTIKEAYDHIVLELKNKTFKNGVELDSFVDYLTEFVTILRVEVPHDTDLNHYFEIMNNRGEQLEKHEVVKSQLLDCLYDDDDTNNDNLQELFHLIWDAVSNMERYVQFGFEPRLRKLLFSSDWSSLKIDDCDTLLEIFNEYKSQLKQESYTQDLSIDEIIEKGYFSLKENTFEIPDRFTSPINFQNFLLHILRIYTKSKEVALDDKRLIDFFKKEIKKSGEDDKQFVLNFMFQLLKGKCLLDKYVIKRQFLANKEGWSLLTLKSNDEKKGFYVNSFGKEDNWDNEIIIALLSMFHVSTPTMVYKHWLNAVLFYLLNEEEINVTEYRSYLERIAKDLICFRFLNNDLNTKLDYYTLIYDNNTLPEDYPLIAYNNTGLNYGNIENNLLFNFLDYIIWINDEDDKFSNFEFTFRSSVEHYFPQNPIGGKKLDNVDALHSFGNLCLISHQKNSKLNHHLPSAKKNYYAKQDGGSQLSYDSLKQFIMMQDYNADTWNELDIFDHQKKMIDLLNEFIQNG